MTEEKFIDIDKVTIPYYHREIKPWGMDLIKQSIQNHGYNPAYPITLDSGNTLVDGRHRLEAARAAGITRIPWVEKPEGVSAILHGLRSNAHGQMTFIDDVFDLAELCQRLSHNGWTGERIAEELEWERTTVVHHIQIKKCLHPRAWSLARGTVTKKPNLVTSPQKNLVTPIVTIVTVEKYPTYGVWLESHFRALIKHLPCTNRDRGSMRAQIGVIRGALKRWIDEGKVTAKWIDETAMQHAWHLELKRYAIQHLVGEVGLGERKLLFKSINNNVFGREESDKNKEKFSRAISLLNEKALGVRLYWDDALQRIPVLKDGSTALVIADPPYNVTDAPWDRFPSPEKYLEWIETWLEVLRPKLARDYHLFLFCDPSYVCRIENLLVQHGWPIKSRIIWAYRNLSMGRDVTDRFISSWQPIFHCGTHPLNWSPDWSDERFDVQLHATPQSNFRDKKHHPMAKPVKLIELFVRVGSKPGDIVLDPFAGGGITGEACSGVKQRRCLLIEKEEEFVAITERRLGINRVREEDIG